MTLTEAREWYVNLICSAGARGLFARMLIETGAHPDAIYANAVHAFHLAHQAERVTF